jgi:hypothetical protein
VPDDIGISASLSGDIGAALEVVTEQVEDLGDAGTRMGTKMRVAGKEAAEGIDEVRKATGRARDANGRFLPTGERVAATLREQGRSAAVTGSMLDRYSRKAKKAARAAGGLGAALMAVKFSILLTGGLALIGMLSALGAAAIMAVGGLAPMVGIFAALGPLAFMGVASMLAFKLAGDAVGETFKPLTEDFKAYGDAIRSVMLPGMRSMVALMRGQLVPVLAGGLINVADIIGYIAEEFGEWATSAGTLNRLGSILQGMSPVMRPIATGLMSILSAILDITDSAMPMVVQMADDFRHVTAGLAAWTEQMRESGRMTAWLNKSWALTKRVVGVLVDIMIGLYNIFRIAGGQAVEMGLSVEALAYKFRLWTDSAEGQAKITKYFQDALPAIRELGLLLGALLGGLGSLAASQDVAPLISQMRTELLPALGLVVEKITGAGGIGPALITAVSQIATAIAQIPAEPMVQLITALGGLVAGISWLLINVPGLATAVGYLSAALIGWKLVMMGATAAMGAFATLKSLLSAIWTVANIAGRVLFFMGKGILFVGRAIAMAMMANPIVAAIMIIIGIILYLWFNCEWFRDAVIAAWKWIAAAAVAAWQWLSDAFGSTVEWLSGAVGNVVDFFVNAWQWISDKAVAVWTAISDAFKVTIDFIAGVANWLYTNVIEPVFSAIAAVVGVYFDVVKFVIQTAIFFIVAIISTIAWAAKAAWDDISSRAQWTFDRVGEAVEFFSDLFTTVVNWIAGKWNDFTTGLGLAWQIFYTTYIKPVIDGFSAAWMAITGYITTKWNELTTMMGLAWQMFYSIYIAPIIQGFQDKWNSFTTFLSEAWNALTTGFGERWNLFKEIVGGAIDAISEGWGKFTQWLSDTFTPVGEMLTNVWGFIEKGATAAAEVVKTAWNGLIGIIKSVWNAIANGWNSIPAITVPDFVPGIGGQTFSLPKLGTLWHGGPTPGGPALVGEQGPEPVIRNGMLAGMVGLNGPEIANLPKGGYVVPNLDTLTRLPGLTKTLPSSVARAVARAVPGYGDLLDTKTSVGSVAAPNVTIRNDDGGVAAALRGLASAVREQRPPMTVGSNVTRAEVKAALREHDRERELSARYKYGS